MAAKTTVLARVEVEAQRAALAAAGTSAAPPLFTVSGEMLANHPQALRQLRDSPLVTDLAALQLLRNQQQALAAEGAAGSVAAPAGSRGHLGLKKPKTTTRAAKKSRLALSASISEANKF